MKRIVLICLFTLITACSTGPITYGDSGGILPVAPRLTLDLMYDGEAKNLQDVGVVVLDGVLQARNIWATDKVKLPRQSFKTGGLGIINTATKSQYHFLPGKYLIEFCFLYSDQHATRYCLETINQSIEIKAGQIIQLSWQLSGKSWSITTLDGAKDTAEIKNHFSKLLRHPISK